MNNDYWADLTYSKAAPSFDVAEDQADEDSNESSNTGPQYNPQVSLILVWHSGGSGATTGSLPTNQELVRVLVKKERSYIMQTLPWHQALFINEMDFVSVYSKIVVGVFPWFSPKKIHW